MAKAKEQEDERLKNNSNSAGSKGSESESISSSREEKLHQILLQQMCPGRFQFRLDANQNSSTSSTKWKTTQGNALDHFIEFVISSAATVTNPGTIGGDNSKAGQAGQSSTIIPADHHEFQTARQIACSYQAEENRLFCIHLPQSERSKNMEKIAQGGGEIGAAATDDGVNSNNQQQQTGTTGDDVVLGVKLEGRYIGEVTKGKVGERIGLEEGDQILWACSRWHTGAFLDKKYTTNFTKEWQAMLDEERPLKLLVFKKRHSKNKSWRNRTSSSTSGGSGGFGKTNPSRTTRKSGGLGVPSWWDPYTQSWAPYCPWNPNTKFTSENAINAPILRKDIYMCPQKMNRFRHNLTGELFSII